MTQLRRPAFPLVAAAMLSGCADNPLTYYAGAASSSAETVEFLAWGYTIVMVAVVLVIAVLIWLGIARSRRRAASAPVGEVGRDAGGLWMIYWGLGLSTPVLLALAIWNFLATRAIANPERPTEMTVQITGHRWWWEIRYAEPRLPEDVFTTANELVIPVAVPVRIELQSADVIHDFWVPKLGPKMDMIPGKTNVTWLEARDPGTYRGQCAEYCGLEHAHMAFTVRAVTKSQFAQWVNDERAPASASLPNRGESLFVRNCAACHTVRGSAAAGIYGPELTHFASRSTIAAGMLANNREGRERWLAATQQVKPGAMMPTVPLSPVDRSAIVDYLGSLK